MLAWSTCSLSDILHWHSSCVCENLHDVPLPWQQCLTTVQEPKWIYLCTARWSVSIAVATPTTFCHHPSFSTGTEYWPVLSFSNTWSRLDGFHFWKDVKQMANWLNLPFPSAVWNIGRPIGRPIPSWSPGNGNLGMQLSMTLYGMEYPIDQSGSAALAVSSPNLLLILNLLAGEGTVGSREGLAAVQALLTNSWIISVLSTLFGHKSKT